ncbi:hypothetical protein PbB2_02944 [Candidatus Phycosocius bacilliformis]|uniref:Uncharacterized protein n=1 Tax=Candidatus Phycosocius bacilliformis TaxID=1445552 RepID=A0A2P2EDW1_9PROT|nr:hypothetical protein [Candidatus Phycosocius bacilliformis]GBF59252.1 hypothetical protein PbB2_02944 [Candidatus Phycosocius bacilliformis]
MIYLPKAAIEQLVLDQLKTLGCSIAAETEIGPDYRMPEHGAYADFLLPMLMEGEVRVKEAEKFVGDAQ